MIEAVNSAVANATLLRGNLEQAESARSSSPAGNIQQLDKVELQLAPYVSPFVQVDNRFNKAVLQIRDSDTGDVKNQFPSETTLRARAAQAEIESQTIREISSDQPRQASGNISSGVSVSENTQAPESSDISAPRVAEAQVASATFAAQALSSGQLPSTVSVTA